MYSLYMIMQSYPVWNPNILQTVSASIDPNSSTQIDVHFPFLYTSTLPLGDDTSVEPPSRTSRSKIYKYLKMEHNIIEMLMVPICISGSYDFVVVVQLKILRQNMIEIERHYKEP